MSIYTKNYYQIKNKTFSNEMGFGKDQLWFMIFSTNQNLPTKTTLNNENDIWPIAYFWKTIVLRLQKLIFSFFWRKNRYCIVGQIHFYE